MDIMLLMATLFTAAIFGNQVNYHVGRYIGPRVFQWEDSRFFNRSAVDQDACLLRKTWGGRHFALPAAVPHFRTFVAGVGAMAYARFYFVQPQRRPALWFR